MTQQLTPSSSNPQTRFSTRFGRCTLLCIHVYPLKVVDQPSQSLVYLNIIRLYYAVYTKFPVKGTPRRILRSRRIRRQPTHAPNFSSSTVRSLLEIHFRPLLTVLLVSSRSNLNKGQGRFLKFFLTPGRLKVPVFSREIKYLTQLYLRKRDESGTWTHILYVRGEIYRFQIHY